MAFNSLGLMVSILYGIFRYAQRRQRGVDAISPKPDAWFGAQKPVVYEKELLKRKMRSSVMTTTANLNLDARPLPPLPASPPITRPLRSYSVYLASAPNSEEGSPSPLASSATLPNTPRIASVSSFNSFDQANVDDLERQRSVEDEAMLLPLPTRPFARDLLPGSGEGRSASVITSATVEIGLSLIDLMSAPGRDAQRRSAEIAPLAYHASGTPRMI